MSHTSVDFLVLGIINTQHSHTLIKLKMKIKLSNQKKKKKSSRAAKRSGISQRYSLESFIAMSITYQPRGNVLEKLALAFDSFTDSRKNKYRNDTFLGFCTNNEISIYFFCGKRASTSNSNIRGGIFRIFFLIKIVV